MRPKNPRTQNGDEEGEWIMSYADTVTLLLCFFVIFFSESKVGQESDQKDVVVMSSTVEAEQVLSTQAQVKEKEIQEFLLKLRTELEARLEKENLKDYEIVQDERDIFIRLNEKGFFKESSYILLPKGKETLAKIAISLESMQSDLKIEVEGHTDSKPVRSSAHYSSNLGLSSLRASSAAEVLILNGVSKDRIKAVGFGDTKPVANDRLPSAENRLTAYDESKARLNRRIELKLLSHNKSKN